MNLLSRAMRGVRARRGRAVLAGLGVLAVSVMVGVAATVAVGLAGGFDRAAQKADLPDAIARFDQQPVGDVAARVNALPNVEHASYRLEATHVFVTAPRVGRTTDQGVVQGVFGGRRGYAIVRGRDLRAPDEAVIEQGLADDWGMRVGDTIIMRGAGGRPAQLRVVGIGLSPDTVAYPLATGPRIYVAHPTAGFLFANDARDVSMALIWVRDRSRLDVTLGQARAASYGLDRLQFVTRDGIRLLVDRAGGIVIALLVAVCVIALAGAGLMLAASAHAEVQRRLEAIGVMRAVGATRRGVTAQFALEAALIALPAGALGLLAGALIAAPPTAHLLAALNELPPGLALIPVLGLCLLVLVALVAAASAWPAWRAAGRPPAQILRGGALGPKPRGRALPSGSLGLGMRIAASRPWRTGATALVLAVSGALVLLLLAVASTLDRLQNDPALVGKRYQLTVPGGFALPQVRHVPGVGAAGVRTQQGAADSFDLGETFAILGFPGRPDRWESPPLLEGRRAQARGEVEVGSGLADALNLRPGSILAAQLGSGRELRFRVTGIVRSFDNDGRIALTQRTAALDEAAEGSEVMVELAPGASRAAVVAVLEEAGLRPQTPAAVTTRSAGFVTLLARLVRVVALVDALVCLYAVAQMLTLTARERRGSVAVLRAVGAAPRQVIAVFAGASLLVVGAALPLALLAEPLLLGPAAARLAAGYAELDLGAGTLEIAAVVGGFLLISLASARWVALRALREPVVAALRDE